MQCFLTVLHRLFLPIMQRLFFCSYRGNLYLSNDKQESFNFHIDIFVSAMHTVSSIMQKLFFFSSNIQRGFLPVTQRQILLGIYCRYNFTGHAGQISSVIQVHFLSVMQKGFYWPRKDSFCMSYKYSFPRGHAGQFPSVVQRGFSWSPSFCMSLDHAKVVLISMRQFFLAEPDFFLLRGHIRPASKHFFFYSKKYNNFIFKYLYFIDYRWTLPRTYAGIWLCIARLPREPGHGQPHLPADRGSRLPQSRYWRKKKGKLR